MKKSMIFKVVIGMMVIGGGCCAYKGGELREIVKNTRPCVEQITVSLCDSNEIGVYNITDPGEFPPK